MMKLPPILINMLQNFNDFHQWILQNNAERYYNMHEHILEYNDKDNREIL